MIDNRRIDYILHNPCYIGKIRFCPDGTKSVSQRRYDNENIMVVDAHHDPIISMDVWEKVQKRLEIVSQNYPKYAKKEQPVQHLLKGLIRCSSCGSTMSAGGVSGKNKTRCLQCCNYQRGACKVSHSITIPKLEEAFISGLKQAIGDKQFVITPPKKKKDDKAIDYEKLIAVEERKLQRAREAYLNEIDTLEQYAKNKEDALMRIEALKTKRDQEMPEDINTEDLADKVISVYDFITRTDVSLAAKNEALHTIIEKVVYEKAEGNLAIYFHGV
jgi:hypothetical protein